MWLNSSDWRRKWKQKNWQVLRNEIKTWFMATNFSVIQLYIIINKLWTWRINGFIWVLLVLYTGTGTTIYK